MELALRALMPEDAGAAHALVGARLGGTRYAARAAEMLDAALGFEVPEYMALLASPDDDPRPNGLVLFGAVAGARAVVKVHAVLAAEPGPAAALLDAVRGACERSGERLLVCELADDVPFAVAAESLPRPATSKRAASPTSWRTASRSGCSSSASRRRRSTALRARTRSSPRGRLVPARRPAPRRHDPVHARVRDRLAQVLVRVRRRQQQYTAAGGRRPEEIDRLLHLRVRESTTPCLA